MATYQLHTIPGVEIFSAGTHRGEPYTRKDLDRIVRNFYRLQGDKRFGDTENRLDPTCVLGHEEDEDQMILKYSGLPAAGVVKRLRRKGDKLIADFADVPEPVANAVKNRNYRKVSAELYDNFEDGGKNLGLTLRRVALLGGEIPEIKNLADLPFPQVQKHSEQSAKKLYTFSELRFAPPKKRVRKFATQWQPGRSESGSVKATNPATGQTLYGKQAEAALRGKQPKQQQQSSSQRSPAMAKVSGAVSKAIQASKPVRKILSQAISKSKTMAKDVFNGLRKVAGYSAKKARQVMKKMFRVADTMATNTMQFMGEVGKKYGPLSAMAAGAIYASTGLAAIGDDKNPTRRALARTVALWASKPIRLGGDAVKGIANYGRKELIGNVLTELDLASQNPGGWFETSLFAARQMARGVKTVAKVAGKAGKLAGRIAGFAEGNDKPNLKKITQAVNLIEKMVASASGTTPRKHSWRLVKKKLAEIFGNQSMKFSEIRKFGNWDYYRGSGKPSGDGWTEYKRRSGGVGYKRKRGSSGSTKKSSSRTKSSPADLDASRSLKLAIERGKEFGRKAQEAREKFEQAGSWEEKTRWRNEARAFQQEAEREAAKARKLGLELRANRANPPQPRFTKQISRLKGREAKAEAYVKGLEDEAQYHLDAYRSLDKRSRENSQRLREIQKRLQGLKVVPRQERSYLMKEQREREAKQAQMDAQLQRASDNMYSSFQRAKKARANIKKLTQGPRTMFAEIHRFGNWEYWRGKHKPTDGDWETYNKRSGGQGWKRKTGSGNSAKKPAGSSKKSAAQNPAKKVPVANPSEILAKQQSLVANVATKQDKNRLMDYIYRNGFPQLPWTKNFNGHKPSVVKLMKIVEDRSDGRSYPPARTAMEKGWITDGKIMIRTPETLKPVLRTMAASEDQNIRLLNTESITYDSEKSTDHAQIIAWKPEHDFTPTRKNPASQIGARYLIQDVNGEHYKVDAKYVDTVKKNFPKAELYIDPKKRIAFKQGNQLVAVIAPLGKRRAGNPDMSVDDARDIQDYDFSTLQPSGTADMSGEVNQVAQEIANEQQQREAEREQKRKDEERQRAEKHLTSMRDVAQRIRDDVGIPGDELYAIAKHLGIKVPLRTAGVLVNRINWVKKGTASVRGTRKGRFALPASVHKLYREVFDQLQTESFAESKYIYTGKVPKGWKKVGDTPKGIKIAKVGGSGKEFEIPKKPMKQNTKRQKAEKRLRAATDFKARIDGKSLRAAGHAGQLMKQIKQAKTRGDNPNKVKKMERKLMKIASQLEQWPDREADARIKNKAARQAYNLAKVKAAGSVAEYLMQKGTDAAMFLPAQVSSFVDKYVQGIAANVGEVEFTIPLGIIDLPVTKGMLNNALTQSLTQGIMYANKLRKKFQQEVTDQFAEQGIDEQLIMELLDQIMRSFGIASDKPSVARHSA